MVDRRNDKTIINSRIQSGSVRVRTPIMMYVLTISAFLSVELEEFMGHNLVQDIINTWNVRTSLTLDPIYDIVAQGHKMWTSLSEFEH